MPKSTNTINTLKKLSQPAGAPKKPRPSNQRPSTRSNASERLSDNPSSKSSDPPVVMHLRVPWSVKRATRAAARAQGLSVSAYVAACLSVPASAPVRPSLWHRLVSWFTVVRF